MSDALAGVPLTQNTWRRLEADMLALEMPLEGPVVPVVSFLQEAGRNPLTPEERLTIVEQAELLLKHLYAHLPFKRQLFGLPDPRVLLKRVRQDMDEISDVAFHSRMIEAFSSLRDAHTTYGLPAPFSGAIAFLPFQMRCVTDSARRRRFYVTRVMVGEDGLGFGHPLFDPGAEIVRWGGVSIQEHVERQAECLPGGNVEAKFARATLACTLRPLTSVMLPDPSECHGVSIEYRPRARPGAVEKIVLPWGVARFSQAAAMPGKVFSVSTIDEELRCGNRLQYRDQLFVEKHFQGSDDFRAVSKIPDVFEFQFTGGPRQGYSIQLSDLAHPRRPEARFGYLRIKAFRDNGAAVGMTERLVQEAKRILEVLDEAAPDGLVLDLRGNAGGDIVAAERMLQLFTPDPITPVNFHYGNRPAIRKTLRRVRGGQAVEDVRLEFDPWLDNVTGKPRLSPSEPLTSGHPLTHPAAANDIGQVYHGPVVLLTDAFTYSAADIFAAGFQDHGIGFLIGADAFTGGGGANVWTHSELLAKLGGALDIGLAPLPRGVTMRVSLRRCSRVGFNAGKPIEDFGVRVNEIYQVRFVDDLRHDFPGMVRRAVEMFCLRPEFRVDVDSFTVRNDVFAIKVRSTNVSLLRFFFDGEFAAERRIRRDETRTFRVSAKNRISPLRLKVEGWAPAADPKTGRIRGNAIASSRTVVLREGAPESASEDSASERASKLRRRRT